MQIKRIFNKIISFFYTPPQERPYNWKGFTEGVYTALYVVILIYGIDLLTEFSKTEKADEIWEITMIKLTFASLLMFIFGILHLRNLRKKRIRKPKR